MKEYTITSRGIITKAHNAISTLECTADSMNSYLNMWLENTGNTDPELSRCIYTAICINDRIIENINNQVNILNMANN
ncbi:hypothetical protein EHW66_21240 [Erwinia psidii]|uniref:hypothetical protein n=1 Tax=Erwinia psidii TaxID=69224 RepID=UPI00226B1495|nr:hypothetical protein [Erwinia psidii]MCX8967395.1 hypothetical protein [Erwinia psidii]